MDLYSVGSESYLLTAEEERIERAEEEELEETIFDKRNLSFDEVRALKALDDK